MLQNMAYYIRRRRARGSLFGCLFAAIVTGATVLGAIIFFVIAVIVGVNGSSGADPAPESSTPAPVEGGWSSGG